jgi:hypothetical protein
MNTLSIEQIAEKYRKHAIKKGSEFLFGIDASLSLIDDLGQNGILVAGCSLWKYVDRDKNWIVELLGAGFSGGEWPTTAERAAMDLKRFLSTDLPEDTELVSFIFDDISVYDVFDRIIPT